MSRIFKEYAQLRKRLEQPEYIWIHALRPVNDEDMSQWTCEFVGPEESAYEGFEFKLEIHVDADKYPIHAPSVKFEPYNMVHPNVKWSTGEICLDLLKDSWTPMYRLLDVVGAIRDLLLEPGLDSPLELDLAHIYAADYDAFAQLVKYRLIERDFSGVDR